MEFNQPTRHCGQTFNAKNVLTYKQYDSYKDFLHALVTHDEEALKISSVCDFQWNFGTKCNNCPVSDFIHCPEVEKRKKVNK